MSTASTAFALVMAASKSTTSSSSSGSALSLVFLVVLFAIVYFAFLRPRSQAARRQRNALMELSSGDEVLTAAGIFGTVLDVEGDRVTLETAPGTRITVLRSTIARRMTEPGTVTPYGDQTHSYGSYGEQAHELPGGEAPHDDIGEQHAGDEPDLPGAAGAGGGR